MEITFRSRLHLLLLAIAISGPGIVPTVAWADTTPNAATIVADGKSAYNIVIATHTYNGLTQIANLHFAAAIPAHIRGYVEWDPGKHNVFRDKLVKPAVKVKDGLLEVPNGPGLGVELSDEMLEQLPFIEGAEILGVPRRRTWAAGT